MSYTRRVDTISLEPTPGELWLATIPALKRWAIVGLFARWDRSHARIPSMDLREWAPGGGGRAFRAQLHPLGTRGCWCDVSWSLWVRAGGRSGIPYELPAGLAADREILVSNPDSETSSINICTRSPFSLLSLEGLYEIRVVPKSWKQKTSGLGK